MNIEKKIETIIEPTITDLGLEIVKVSFINDERNTLQILLERLDRDNIGVDDCAKASRAVSAILDVEDPISSEYVLEVSSPGIARPLTKLEHFDRFAGHEAKLETTEMMNGRKRFRGTLKGIKDNKVLINVENEEFQISIDSLLKAKLVLTDELIKANKEGTK